MTTPKDIQDILKNPNLINLISSIMPTGIPNGTPGAWTDFFKSDSNPLNSNMFDNRKHTTNLLPSFSVFMATSVNSPDYFIAGTLASTKEESQALLDDLITETAQSAMGLVIHEYGLVRK